MVGAFSAYLVFSVLFSQFAVDLLEPPAEGPTARRRAEREFAECSLNSHLRKRFWRENMASSSSSTVTLKCYFCDTGPILSRPKWYRCSRLHHICQQCKDVVKISHCPCDARILATSCKFTEEMLNAKVKENRCIYEDLGCNYKVTQKTKLGHEKKCQYRLINCPFYFCNASLPFNKIVDHVTYEEEVSQTFTSDTLQVKAVENVQLEKDSLRVGFRLGPRRFELDGRLFFSNGLTLKDGDTFYHWVTIIGTKEEAEQYRYSFAYFGGKDQDIGFAYFACVISVEEDKHEIINNVRCFSLNFEVFKEHFVSEVKDFKFRILISVSEHILSLSTEIAGRQMSLPLERDDIERWGHLLSMGDYNCH